MLTIRIRCVNPLDKQQVPEAVEIDPAESIKSLKEKLTESNDVPLAEVKLIYKGKVLRDEDTVKSYEMNDKVMLVYLRSKKKVAAPPPIYQAEAPTSNSPAGAPSLAQNQTSTNPAANAIPNPFASLGGFGGFGAGTPSNGQMPSMDQMRNMMSNPMIQSMMSNPDFIRSMTQANPMIRQMMENNPQLSHILNDPSIMREYMAMMQDPSRMQDMMRQQDLQLNNIESMPGGANALRRMYEEVQQPLQEAARMGRESSDSTSDASNNEADSGAANPWGEGRPNTESTSSTDGVPRSPGLGIDFTAMMQAMNSGMGGLNLNEMMRPENMALIDQLQRNLMMGGGMGGTTSTPGTSPVDHSLPPEERFSGQLRQLEDMGFTNRRDNIAALQVTGGNVNAAIDRLLGGGL